MKIQTFSVVAGSAACNARCPFCVSKMTVPNGVGMKLPEVNWRNFHKACRLAQLSGATTAMITSKGEPTLFPEQITEYLRGLSEYNFPLIELQTNGTPLPDMSDHHLNSWYNLGLGMIAISTVHYEREMNKQIFFPHKKEYIDLPELIAELHNFGFSVRLVCTLLDGYIDGPEKIQKYLDFAQHNKVEQVKMTPVTSTDWSSADMPSDIHNWIRQNGLKGEQLYEIRSFLNKEGTKLMSLMHGATVYDVDGQNVCFSDCLTKDGSSEDVRQLIFFPDGHLRFDWQYEGAILL
ncbi:MAG: hypothetical protein ACWGQW_18910 [bacterium]